MDASFSKDILMAPLVWEDATVFTGIEKPVAADNFFDKKPATLFTSSDDTSISMRVVFFKLKKPLPSCNDTGWGIILIELLCAETKKKLAINTTAIVNLFMCFIKNKRYQNQQCQLCKSCERAKSTKQEGFSPFQ